MTVRLKPLDRQVIVITGASSGIGLTTARMAARRGAAVVLAARNEAALQRAADEIGAEGGRAVPVAADVGRESDVERIVREAVRRFGGFDAWINAAAVGIYGSVEQVPIEDQRRLFETNYWGVVYGSLAAAKLLKRRGGAIINLGSVLSDRTPPLRGVYAASMHAVKAFTDTLRTELEHEGAPVSVTLIKPSSIDAPSFEHVRSGTDGYRTNPPPAYVPELAAKAILHACEHRRRELVVGSGGWIVATLGSLFPRAMDLAVKAAMFRRQTGTDPGRPARPDNLDGPCEDRDARSSLLLEAQLHPWAALAVVVGLGYAAGRLTRPNRRAGP